MIYLYGKDKIYIDVTKRVEEEINKYGYVYVSNEIFTDPYPGYVKELKVISHDQETYVTEGNLYIPLNKNSLQINKRLKCYYHCFCSELIVDIFDEQIKLILESPIYNNFESINCCVSGNNLKTYNLVLEKLRRLEKATNKIKIRKAIFGDKSYERFTLNEIKNDSELNELNENTYILYIHSKGASRQDKDFVRKWRNCLMHFLLTKGDKCIDMFLNNDYDTVGALYIGNHIAIYPDGHTDSGTIYAGNFWWAKGSYLSRLFQKHIIGPQYYDPEFFLFKENPKVCDLYEWRWDLQPLEENNWRT